MSDDKRFIVVFCGPPCSGKSSLINAVCCSRTDLSPHSMDDIRQEVLPSPINDKQRRSAAYRVMHFRATQDPIKNKPVALDATYIPPEPRAEIAATALRLNVRLYVIQCVCTGEEAVQGLVCRGPKHPGADLTPARVKDMAEHYERFESALVLNRHAMADSSGTGVSAGAVSLVQDYLNARIDVDPVQWARHDYMPNRGAPPQASPLAGGPQKLSRGTLRWAQRSRRVYRLGLLMILVPGILGILCGIGTGLRWLSRTLPYSSDPMQSFGILLLRLRSDTLITIGVFLVAVAGLSTLFATYFKDTRPWHEEVISIVNAGKTQRYNVIRRLAPPSDMEIYQAYWCRSDVSARQARMPLQDVPVFFQILPETGRSFGTVVRRIEPEDSVASELESEAAKVGLDWIFNVARSGPRASISPPRV